MKDFREQKPLLRCISRSTARRVTNILPVNSEILISNVSSTL